MQVDRQSRLEARARILKALGHSSRLMILEELAGGEKCVAELTEAVGSDMSTVSKHLTLLKSVGLVQDRRQGTQIFYRLMAPCVLGFFECVEKVMNVQVQQQILLAK
jgi:DNA-binding transcriptional ArsR family regulator